MDDADRLNSPLLPPRFLPGAPDEPFRFQGIPGIEATRGGNRFAVLARSRALLSAGSSMEARIAMIAITTRSSINVNRNFLICNMLR